MFYGKSVAEINRKITEYQYGVEQGPTFETVIEDWWEDHQKHLVASTIRGYIASVNRAKNHFKDTRIKELTPQQCDSFIRSLASQGKGKKVCHTQLNIMRMVCDYAVLKGYIAYNPCSAVKLPSGLPAKKRELPSEADIKAVEESDWLFPFFLLYTGMRRSEALAVMYEDIDRERRVIHVNKAVGYANNRPYIKSTKTEAGKRDVILLDKLAERIPEGHGLIFTNDKGEMYHGSHISRAWESWQKANNTTVTPHQLRHGYATILHDAGIDVKDAQYLLGHSTVAMTQDVYTHIRQSRINEAGDKLNDFLK